MRFLPVYAYILLSRNGTSKPCETSAWFSLAFSPAVAASRLTAHIVERWKHHSLLFQSQAAAGSSLSVGLGSSHHLFMTLPQAFFPNKPPSVFPCQATRVTTTSFFQGGLTQERISRPLKTIFPESLEEYFELVPRPPAKRGPWVRDSGRWDTLKCGGRSSSWIVAI